MPGSLEEIRNWKLEAKFEDTEKYFYEFSAVDRLTSGDKFFVVGRKGTGKTAISEYLRKINKYDVFAEKLTFKNFPFNELYSRRDDKFILPNQYITLWKYLIYSFVCKLMAKNAQIDRAVSVSLSQLYAPDAETNLRRMLERWTASEFSVNVLGSGGKVSKKSHSQVTNWIEKCDVLEDVVKAYCDNSTYFILFDELDEDYKDMINNYQKSEYLSLITSLFKAVMDVVQIFREYGKNIFPIVFLRDDIYDLIQDADKNKWNDFKIELEWSKEHIQSLLSFRLSRAANPVGAILPFHAAWRTAFADTKVRFGFQQKSRIDSFDFIARSAQQRPRDFIRYIQVCAEFCSRAGKSIIDAETVRREDKSFSNYLREELDNEIQGLLPDIREIFDTLAHLRKQEFGIVEFRRIYQDRLRKSLVKTPDPDFVLQVLFHFSVVGNKPSQRMVDVFKFKNKEARFNANEQIVIHRGLYKSLQII